MKPALVFAALGLLAVIALVLHYDAGALGNALGAVGIFGLSAAVAANFVPLLLCSAAWCRLQPGRFGLLAFVWFRYTRDTAGDLLGFIPAAGEFAALSQMNRWGIERRAAVPALVADLTVQMLGQLIFTLTGGAVLLSLSPHSPLARATVAGLVLLAAMLAAFIAVQRLGIGRILAPLARRLLPNVLPDSRSALAEFDASLRAIYADSRRVAMAAAFHIAAWFVGIAEAAVILFLLGAWPGLVAVLVVESLVVALRTTAFFIPGAWGVQEAAYVLLGSVFGLAPETMLAVALIKRAREVTVGVPVLLAGQALFAFRRSSGRDAAAMPARYNSGRTAPLPR